MRRVASLLGLLIVIAVGAVLVTTRHRNPSSTPTASTASSKPAPSTTGSTAPPDAAEAALTAAERPAGPTQLAAAIARAEHAIRSPATSADRVGAWAHVQQRAYRTLAHHPEWDSQVDDAVGSDLVDIVGANVRANRELWAITAPRDALPEWHIVAPPPADDLLADYRAAGHEYGVPWEDLAAIHLVESRMGRIRGDSTAGAKGPMQFLPSTWAQYGEGDIENPRDAIRAAARYLVAHGAPADMAAALHAYNHSDHYVRAVEAYAGIMRDDARAYLGYYHWQVFYRLKTGDVILPVGWPEEPAYRPPEG